MTQCNICGIVLDYTLDKLPSKEESLGFRETLDCPKCGSISRDRGIMWALSSVLESGKLIYELKEKKTLKILEIFGLRYYPKLLDKKFDYINPKHSKFLPKLKFFPKKFADLQRLFYRDHYFDFVITSDIFEHVRLDDKAFLEVFRVLKDGGYFLMTIPFDYSAEKTIEKIQVIQNNDVFLTKPEYHNQGVEDGGDSLSYRTYGKSLFEKLTKIGFNVEYLNVQIPRYAISQMDLFLCRKIQPIDIEINNDVQVVHKDFFVNPKNE